MDNLSDDIISLKEDQQIFKDGDPYKSGLHELVLYYCRQKNPIDLVLKFSSIRSIVEGFYQVLVNHKEIEPVEKISLEGKRRIWKLTRGCEERLKAAKGIFLIEQILKK